MTMPIYLKWVGAMSVVASIFIHTSATAQPLTEEKPSQSDERMYWNLNGGGEVVGKLIKQTPEEVFIDIGPKIIGVPIGGIASSSSFDEVREKLMESPLATGSSTTDPQTGTVIFRASKASNELMTQTEIVEKVKKSVVLISNPRGAGSGFILDREGRIVTNHHVVHSEKYHTINLFKKRGNQFERVKIENAEVEAYSPLYDIAILKMDLDQVEKEGIDLQPLPVASPDSLEVGDPVYAVGNPGMGRRLLEHSVSEGIVSSLARNVGDVIYIQTTAAVNPGNSGGPLVNQRGEVVGLVTLKAVFQEGIAFALPSSLIRHFLENSESYAYSEQANNKGFRYLSPE